ncbi:MAG: hypothetical protein GXZ03_01065 [Proteiniphilum sp.]|nr:hypothetical protein [Proteiniphilum sp.]
MRSTKYPVTIALTFLWIGFVCAISFMEAWLKFQAPGITLELGLGIGKLVFNALNKVEWALAIIIIIHTLISRQSIFKGKYLLISLVVFILTIQSFWLLPALFERANMHIEAQSVSSSSFAHYTYIAVEVIKIIALTLFGVSLLRNK